jgi:hypothetical protein
MILLLENYYFSVDYRNVQFSLIHPVLYNRFFIWVTIYTRILRLFFCIIAQFVATLGPTHETTAYVIIFHDYDYIFPFARLI